MTIIYDFLINYGYPILCAGSFLAGLYYWDIRPDFRKETMFCPSCGTLIKKGSKFCAKCGQKVEM